MVSLVIPNVNAASYVLRERSDEKIHSNRLSRMDLFRLKRHITAARRQTSGTAESSENELEKIARAFVDTERSITEHHGVPLESRHILSAFSLLSSGRGSAESVGQAGDSGAGYYSNGTIWCTGAYVCRKR